MHCEVVNWKPSVLKKMYSVFNYMKDELKENEILFMYAITPNPKFAYLFGGEFSGIVKSDGKDYEVVKWDLNY